VKQSSALYGQGLTMSASRIDKFYACRFLYFLQYGLNARPRKPAGFDAPTAGTFMHYILENVARDIRDGGGFHDIGDDGIKALTQNYVARYVSQSLDGFKDIIVRGLGFESILVPSLALLGYAVLFLALSAWRMAMVEG
jgi:ATP-dependent helicase/nuclease subunit B